MEDTFLEDDENTNAQLNLKIFMKLQIVIVINCMNKKYDKIISTTLRDTKAYDFCFNKFYLFSPTCNFLTPKERDLHCSHQIVLRTKQTHTYT